LKSVIRENPPKQARSRHTLHRLLSAAEALLEHGGLDAATVPAIAEAAGLSVGVVYRRFPDKDALMRAVYERFFTTMRDQNLLRLKSVVALERPLPIVARAMILGIAEGYRRKRGLLRALYQYAQTHPDPAFRREARKMNRETMNAVIGLLLSHRNKIRHPNPEVAIGFGLLAVASILKIVILEESPDWLRMPEQLDEELVRLFFRYLGIREPRKH